MIHFNVRMNITNLNAFSLFFLLANDTTNKLTLWFGCILAYRHFNILNKVHFPSSKHDRDIIQNNRTSKDPINRRIASERRGGGILAKTLQYPNTAAVVCFNLARPLHHFWVLLCTHVDTINRDYRFSP